MKMFMVFDEGKTKKRIVFDSKYYEEIGDVIRITIPKGDVGIITEINKANVHQIEKYSSKEDHKRQVVNPLTAF